MDVQWKVGTAIYVYFTSVLLVVKVKAGPLTCQAGNEGLRDNRSTHNQPGPQKGVGDQRQAPSAFTPGRRRGAPSYRRLSGPRGHSGWVLKISLTPRFEPRTVQPIAIQYIDYANGEGWGTDMLS